MLDPVRLEAYAAQGTEFLNRHSRETAAVGYRRGWPRGCTDRAGELTSPLANNGRLFFSLMPTTTEVLALHGGPRAVPIALPSFLHSDGRTFGEAEESLVLEALRSGCLTRNGGQWCGASSQLSPKSWVPATPSRARPEAPQCISPSRARSRAGRRIHRPACHGPWHLLPILWQNCIPAIRRIFIRTR